MHIHYVKVHTLAAEMMMMGIAPQWLTIAVIKCIIYEHILQSAHRLGWFTHDIRGKKVQFSTKKKKNHINNINNYMKINRHKQKMRTNMGTSVVKCAHYGTTF